LRHTPKRKTEMLARLGLLWSLPGAHDIVPTRIRQVGYVWRCCSRRNMMEDLYRGFVFTSSLLRENYRSQGRTVPRLLAWHRPTAAASIS